mmetsp:Transcript_18441/g.58924  ORF Transcript_18441/g.58924 Transcript_18441/m.58924 type:complete len:302 (-) Transcript_18441:749-1654(-)
MCKCLRSNYNRGQRCHGPSAQESGHAHYRSTCLGVARNAQLRGRRGPSRLPESSDGRAASNKGHHARAACSPFQASSDGRARPQAKASTWSRRHWRGIRCSHVCCGVCIPWARSCCFFTHRAIRRPTDSDFVRHHSSYMAGSRSLSDSRRLSGWLSTGALSPSSGRAKTVFCVPRWLFDCAPFRLPSETRGRCGSSSRQKTTLPGLSCRCLSFGGAARCSPWCPSSSGSSPSERWPPEAPPGCGGGCAGASRRRPGAGRAQGSLPASAGPKRRRCASPTSHGTPGGLGLLKPPTSCSPAKM